ncbi:MAG TPA: response regulator transcription factor [Vicinamibacteria bacterium]|jgi:DNA-binding NarL/FixJ family response regulator
MIRLLICDDHTLFRAGVRSFLNEQPTLEVVGEAQDGQTALKEVERLRPDLVLMDVEMPRLSGIEATRRITQSHSAVKVLMLTMYVEEPLVARCLEAGASGYVLKDVPVSQLFYAIEAVARGERYLSPGAVDKVIDERGQPLGTARTKYDLLTDREREVLKLLADGLSIKEVAARLDRSVKTAEAHKYNLMRKLGVHDRAGLIKYAIAHRLVQVPVVEDLIDLPEADRR